MILIPNVLEYLLHYSQWEPQIMLEEFTTYRSIIENKKEALEDQTSKDQDLRLNCGIFVL